MRLANWLPGWLPARATVGKDLLAGLPGAISSVPDGMASGVLAGVGPANGLYASVVGPVVGGATASTRLMVVATTGAAALATASTLADIPAEQRVGAMTLLSLMTGAVMIAAGLLRLGRYTRFVSHSVMTGFLTGVAVNIVLGQLGDLTGTDPDGSIGLTKGYWFLTHLDAVDVSSLLVGIGAMALLVLLARTPVGAFGAVIALLIPTVAVVIFHLDSVAQVRDAGSVPAGFPLPHLPTFSSFSFGLLAGAFAVAVIVLVQGVGVAEAAPNPDGRASVNRDFLAQGFANVAGGLFLAQPVGASVGQTALNIASGARTRWAAIFSGLWLLAILLALSALIGYVASPTLAALLVVAAVGSIRPAQITTILRTGTVSQIAFGATLVATLLLPVTAAVAVGVAISLALQLNREALDLRVVRLVPEGARWREAPAPPELSPHEVVVLDVYGSLLYAGPRTLQAKLPATDSARRSAVVIRLRGRTQLGATFFAVVDSYAKVLRDSDSRLFLAGVEPELRAQHRRSRGGPDRDLIDVFEGTDLVGESTDAAMAAARAWTDGAP